MRNVDSHLLEDKMDEAVTHYINSHQPGEPVQVDAYTAFNIQNDTGNRVVTVMQSQNFSSQMCRQVSVGEQVTEGGSWDHELLDPDGKLAALVAHLAQNSRTSHHQATTHHKIPLVRNDVESSVMLDAPMRLFNGQTLDQQIEPIVVQVPHLPPLPPLQEVKRCLETDLFGNKAKTTLKDNTSMLTETDGAVIELGPGASPAQNKQQSKKSLPHKKRISRKLKRNTGNSTPQQDIVVINCSEEVQQEEILPDNFVTGVQHQEHLPEDTHHITHQVRPIFICQICSEFYGEEQLKFYQHLKQHYEPQTTIIIENPVPDLGIDKMTNTCIVDNVAALPDSIVELSLENTVPKTMYQPIDKHILYTSTDKTLSYTNNKVQYSIASIEKEHNVPTSESEKPDMYDALDKLDVYTCTKCNKSFRKQKQCEAHIEEAHSHSKLEDMGEFSEPEDLMEGIHVAVEEGGEQYEQALLPHLTVENGHVHQEHIRHWYIRNGSGSGGGPLPCGSVAAMGAEGTVVTEGTVGAVGSYCPVCPACPAAREQAQSSPQLKEEVLQRIFETEVANNDNANYTDNIITENGDIQPEQEPPPKEDSKSVEVENDKKKAAKKFECTQCDRIFRHRNSLLYHVLSHSGKQQVCKECGKGFYTAGALKTHKRVHNGDRPYKCDDCGRDFRQWGDLKYHKISKHSNQKHFKCEFCSKEFARKYSLSVHRRIHTGEKNYKCEYCNKTFSASSYRLSHMRIHTGDKPYKCAQCGKCFRVTGDLRRHMLTHEKVRNRFHEQKNKTKETKDSKKTPSQVKNMKYTKADTSDAEMTEQSSNQSGKVKKIATASTTRPPILKNTSEKKQTQKSTKRNQGVKKTGAPNVAVSQNKVASGGQFKDTEYPNEEVFNTRQVNGPFNKFKEVYSEDNVNDPMDSNPYGKVKDGYSEQIIIEFKDEQRLNEERDFAILRPMFRGNGLCDSVDNEKTVFRSRTENTDGKMTVFTHVDKNKEYTVPIVGSQGLTDLRHLEREVGREVRSDSLHGETIENVFFEKLSALYNIPAV